MWRCIVRDQVETPRRWGFRVVLGAVALLPLLLVGGVTVSSELRAKRLAERLVADAVVLANQRRERPPHREATHGSVTRCLEAALDTAPDVSRDVPWMTPQSLAVRRGEAPLESLPSSALEALTKHDPWLRSTLACTHLDTLEAGAGLGPLADPLHPRRQALPTLQETTAALAPLRVRLLVEHGQLNEALEVCGDALALAGDLLWLEGPEASLGALGQATSVVPPCAEALWRAQSAEAATFQLQLARLRANAPLYSRVVQLERVAQELHIFGAFVTAEQATSLPVGPSSMVRTASSLSRSRVERVGLARWWSSADRAFTGVIAAADLPEPRRSREIVLAQKDFESRWLSLVKVPPLDVRYQMYAESHEALPMALELLGTVAQLREGATPATTFIDVAKTPEAIVLSPKTTEWKPLEVRLRLR